MASSETRAAVWVAAAAVVGGVITWAFSWSGAATASLLFGLSLSWWPKYAYGPLLTLEAIGLLAAFLLTRLALRRWSAPPQLWLGALAASLLIAGRYLVGAVELMRIHSAGGRQELFYGGPFFDPVAALLALMGLPVVVGLACWLVTRRRMAHAVAPEGDGAHA